MTEETKAFIEERIKAGNYRDIIRNELISNGHSTEGFNEFYVGVLAKLGLKEPVRPFVPPESTELYEEMQNGGPKKTTVLMHNLWSWFLYICVIVLALGIVGVVVVVALDGGKSLGLSWGEEGSDDFGVTDGVLEAKVESTVASARVQGTRMGAYDGVCRDIAVVAPVRCRDTVASFAVSVPLSNGKIYCHDSNGFAGVVDKTEDALCK